MGHFVPLDVLSKGTFSPLGRLVPWDVLSLGTFGPLGRFVPWEVFSMGRFVPGTFGLGTFSMCIVIHTAPTSWPYLKLVNKNMNSSENREGFCVNILQK